MKTTNLKTPSLTKLLSGKCSDNIYENMKIILSRTTTSNPIDEMFLVVGKTEFFIVRIIDIEYEFGYLVLNVIDKESGIKFVISHSINDEVPMYKFIKLNDILLLSEISKNIN